MSVNQVLSPLAQISWDGAPVSTDQVRLMLAVGQDPTLSVSAFSGSEASKSSQAAFTSEASALMGRAQAAAFSTPEPNFRMRLQDGAGSTLNFLGMVIGPSFTTDRQSNTQRPALSVMSANALLGNLRLSIYLGVDKAPNSPMNARNTLMGSYTDSDNLAERMADLTDSMIELWLAYRNNSGDQIAERIKDNIHLANEGPLKIWKQILSNSEDTLDLDWLKTLAKDKQVNNLFNNELAGLLRSPTGSFLDTMARISSAFSLQYIPNANGSPGHLEPREKRMTGEVISKSLPANSVVMGGGLPTPLMPVQQVVIVGKQRSGLLEGAEQSKDAEGLISMTGYPENAVTVNGNIRTIPLPFYLEAYTMAEQQGTSLRKTPSVGSAIKAFRNIRDITQSNLSDRSAALIQGYAKSVYNDLALGGYTSRVSVPLNLTWIPGRRYSLSSGSAGLFRGFLSSVEHEVSKGQIATNLDFTHVEYGGYRLPT